MKQVVEMQYYLIYFTLYLCNTYANTPNARTASVCACTVPTSSTLYPSSPPFGFQPFQMPSSLFAMEFGH